MKKYRVKYFDAVMSRRGKGGVKVRIFDNRNEAYDFASKNKIYANKCKVEEFEEVEKL